MTQEPTPASDHIASASQSLPAGFLTGPDDRCVYCGEPAELVCDDCEAAIAKRNQEIERKRRASKEAERSNWFRDKIPENYRDPDPVLIPQWSRKAVEGWEPAGKAGVTIIGPSDTYKTRTGIALLERAYVAGFQVELRQAGDLRREVNRAAREGEDEKLLRELAKIPVLMIDDIGNQAFTETFEEFLLALIERRTGAGLPTIATTQYPGEEFVAKATNRRIGIAIARRLGPDFSTIIRTDKTKPATIQPHTP